MSSVLSSGLLSSRKTKSYRRGSSGGHKDEQESGASLLWGEMRELGLFSPEGTERISPMHTNISKEDAMRMVPDHFWWCPERG